MVWDSGDASDRCGRPVRAGRASFIMRFLFSTHFVPETLNMSCRDKLCLWMTFKVFGTKWVEKKHIIMKLALPACTGLPHLSEAFPEPQTIVFDKK